MNINGKCLPGVMENCICPSTKIENKTKVTINVLFKKKLEFK